MKQTRTLPIWLTACGLALAMVATATAEAAKQRTAEVVRIKGTARYSVGNNVWQSLKVGTELPAGAIVQTASGSIVDIVLSDSVGAAQRPVRGEYITYNPTVQRDVVRMQPDTVMAIDKLTSTDTGADKVTETQLDLRSGRIIGAVKKISAASTFEIKIPNGVAGIRGTFFSISAGGVISVWDGAVAIAVNTPEGPKVITVEAGFEYDINTGQKTPIPADRPKDTVYSGPVTVVVGQNMNTVYVSPITGTSSSGGS